MLSTFQNKELKDSVIISCCGAFHARHAALAAYQAGMLSRYITTQPRYAQVPRPKPLNARKCIKTYIQQPEHRAQIAARARKRALAEHTYAHRWKELLTAIGWE